MNTILQFADFIQVSTSLNDLDTNQTGLGQNGSTLQFAPHLHSGEVRIKTNKIKIRKAQDDQGTANSRPRMLKGK